MPRESQLEEHSQCCRKRWKLPEVCLESVRIFFYDHAAMNHLWTQNTFQAYLKCLCVTCDHEPVFPVLVFSVPQKKVRSDHSNHISRFCIWKCWNDYSSLIFCKLKWTKIWLWSFVLFFFSSRITSFMGQNKKWCILVPVIAELELSPACARFLFLPLP